MGLKSPIFEGLGHLGIKDKTVAYTSPKSLLERKKDRIAATTSVCTTCHAFLKKCTLKPSDPGALSIHAKDNLLNLNLSNFRYHS